MTSCTSSVLRGAAFGSAFGAAFCGALVLLARFSGSEEPEPVPCVQAVRVETPLQAPREAEGRGSALTRDEAGIEASETQVEALQGRNSAGLAAARGGAVQARTAGSSKADARARRGAGTEGGAAAAGPTHIPRRDPPRAAASDDPAPSAGPAPGDTQQMAALLAQLTQGKSGSSAGAEVDALSPELLEKLLGGGLGAHGAEGVSPELLQKLLGGSGAEGVSPELLQKLLGGHGLATPPDLDL